MTDHVMMMSHVRPAASPGRPSHDGAAAPFISVVIPHYNDLTNLIDCVGRLERQTWPRHRFEIVVGDNNSRYGIEAVQASVPTAMVVPAPIQGAGPARNAAASAARGEILAFIDSDCLPDPDWLRAGVAALARADYVGGQVKTTVRDPWHPSLAEAYEVEFAFNFEKYIKHDKFSGTGNLFVPRRIFDDVGGFREAVSEDVDWCHRANAKGYTLDYAADAIVSHPARETWGDLMVKYDRMIKESYLLNRERPLGRLKWGLRAILVMLSPFAHAPRVIASTRLSGLRAKLTCLLGLFRLRFVRGYKMWRAIVLN